MTYQITIPMWLELPQPLRNKLVEIFSLPRSGGTSISSFGGVMKVDTDGYTHQDLAGISIPKMQDFLGSDETDFWKLLELTINKAEASLPEELKPVIDEKPWCNSCDSRGVRHKKTCPNFISKVEAVV